MFAGIAAIAHLRPNRIHAVIDFGVGVNFVVIKRTVSGVGIIGYILPIFTAVVAAVEARFFSFYDGINAVGI